jgi:hypothetical protein
MRMALGRCPVCDKKEDGMKIEKFDALFLKWLEENGSKFLGDPLAKLRAAFEAGCTAQADADRVAVENLDQFGIGSAEIVVERSAALAALSAARIKGE